VLRDPDRVIEVAADADNVGGVDDDAMIHSPDRDGSNCEATERFGSTALGTPTVSAPPCAESTETEASSTNVTAHPTVARVFADEALRDNDDNDDGDAGGASTRNMRARIDAQPSLATSAQRTLSPAPTAIATAAGAGDGASSRSMSSLKGTQRAERGSK
jgi:hypothetical protein